MIRFPTVGRLAASGVVCLPVLAAACMDAGNATAPSSPRDATLLSPMLGSASVAPPPGKGLVAGVPVSCDNNSTLTVTFVRGGPPGIGPAWFDDGTHTVSQTVTLRLNGEIIYQAQWGNKSDPLPTVTCEGPFPVGDEMGDITVVSTIQP